MNTEDTTKQQHTEYQHQRCHTGLQTRKVGLVVNVQSPWLGASPDDKVLDPSGSQPLGIAEYKNPYSTKDLTLHEACNTIKAFTEGE